jgi:hypothetical protein
VSKRDALTDNGTEKHHGGHYRKMAALTCKAERVDDGYLINAQKTWCSNAHLADHILLVARASGSRHDGMTLFCVPAPAEGLRISGIAPPEPHADAVRSPRKGDTLMSAPVKPSPRPRSEETEEEAPEPERRHWFRNLLRRRVLAAVVVVLVVAATGSSRWPQIDERITADDARASAVDAGTRYATSIAIYDYRDPGGNLDEVVAHATDKFAGEYRDASASLTQRTRRRPNRTKVTPWCWPSSAGRSATPASPKPASTAAA